MRQSSGASSMVVARSPQFMVETKRQGASRWAPLWVMSWTISTAHASPSGRSSFFRPGKKGAICSQDWW